MRPDRKAVLLVLFCLLLACGCGKENPSVPASVSSEEAASLSQPLSSEPQQEESESAAQSTKEAHTPSDAQESVSSGTESISAPPVSAAKQETRDFWQIRSDMVENTRAFQQINPDTVGWLYLWNTTIDSPVFQCGDNDFYLKHNDYGEEDKNGAIVSDFRNVLSGRDTQSLNVVLYAHSKDENPDGGVEASREYEHFTELKRWQDRDFCESHPYFLFATADESMVFEVFAAFHTKTDFVYNVPNPGREQQAEILAQAMKKSLFDFGVEVSPDDRIMTLSTCCRRIVPTYPNGYRFVVMGRLVEAGKPLTYDRTVTENPTALTPDNIYE